MQRFCRTKMMKRTKKNMNNWSEKGARMHETSTKKGLRKTMRKNTIIKFICWPPPSSDCCGFGPSPPTPPRGGADNGNPSATLRENHVFLNCKIIQIHCKNKCFGRASRLRTRTEKVWNTYQKRNRNPKPRLHWRDYSWTTSEGDDLFSNPILSTQRYLAKNYL